jgi:signal transduction histidine kinase
VAQPIELAALRRILVVAPLGLWLTIVATDHLLSTWITPLAALLIQGLVLVPCFGLLGHLVMSRLVDAEVRLRRQRDELDELREAHGLARERLRLAAESADDGAQLLAYVNTESQVIEALLRQGNGAAAQRRLATLASTARSLFASQRARILDLRVLPEQPPIDLADAIRRHVEVWEAETHLPVDLALPADAEAAPEVELQLLRIVQEALHNVRRHARATRVRIELARAGDLWRLEVNDDGVGFDVADANQHDGPRFGLASIRERAGAAGGRLTVESHPGRGTRLLVEMPTIWPTGKESATCAS